MSDQADRRLRQPFFGRGLWELMGRIGALLVLAAIGIVGWQCYEWLRFGEWPSLTVLSVLAWSKIRAPHTEWIGVQKMIDWVLQWPASVPSFIFGAILTGWAVSRLEE